MAADTNPIHYSDLVSPDNSITDLIKQLYELNDTYSFTLKNIKTQAIQLTEALKDVSGATETGRQATRNASSEADKLAKAYKDVAFAESETAKRIAECKQATKEANELNKLHVKLAQSAEGSYNKLSAQYSINKIYLNNMTVAERENTEEGKKLVAQTKAIYEEMKRLQEATGKHSLNVGNYGDFGKELGNSLKDLNESISDYKTKVLDLLGLNNKFAQSLVNLVQNGGGAKAALSAMGDGVKALGASLLSMLTNPVFLAIAGIAGVGLAFKWWYDYNAGLMEATRLTHEFTGLTGDELVSVRNEIQACADVMGHDYKETLESVDSLMANYGMSAREALKVVEDGFASGADLSGDMLEKIKHYAPTFHDAGIGASELVAILQQTRSGIFSDKGLEVITMASKKIREMSDKTKEALGHIGIDVKQVQKDLTTGARNTFDVIQEVSTKMKEFGADSQQVGLVLKDVFGRNGAEAGIKLIEQLDTMSTSIDAVKKQTGEWGEAQQAQIKASAELNDAMSALFDMTDNGFEGMIDQMKLIGTKWLTAIIKGVIDVANWFVRLYNTMIPVRAMVQALILLVRTNIELFKFAVNFAIDAVKMLGNLFETIVKTITVAFKSVAGILSGFGEAIKGVFTFDFDKIKKGVEGIKNGIVNTFKTAFGGALKTFVGFGKEVGKDAYKMGVNFADAFMEGVQKTKSDHLELFALPQGTHAGRVDVAPEKTITNTDIIEDGKKKKKKKKGKKEKKKDPQKEAEKAARAAEAVYKAALEAKRKAEDAELELMEEGYEKQRKRTQYQYDRQVEDLKHALQILKTTNVQQRTDMQNTIVSLEERKAQVLAELERKHQDEMLKLQEEAIKLRLEAVAKGSEQERQLKAQLIELERQQALKANSEKTKDNQQSDSDINAKYNAKQRDLADEYVQAQMFIFQKQQELAESEFLLLQTSEERKTRYRMKAEQERLKKILELNKVAGTKLSDVEVQTIKNTIARIDKEIEQSKKDEQSKDIYGLLGLELTDGQKEAIDTSLSYAMDALNTWTEAEVAAAEAEVQRANSRVDSAKSVLDSEREARANGYASNVTYAQKELDLAKRNQEKALKEQEKAKKKQLAIQAVEQIGNLVTATSMIWSQLGFPLAIPAIALMWGSFAFSKIKAAQMVKAQDTESYGEGTVELLEGGSHQSGNDIDLGRKRNGTRRRAEGGEFFAIINKRNSRRYRKVIPDVIRAFNNGTFEDKYSNTFAGKGVEVSVNENAPDLSELTDNVRSIRERNERRTYQDTEGNTIVEYKNLTRKIRR